MAWRLHIAIPEWLQELVKQPGIRILSSRYYDKCLTNGQLAPVFVGQTMRDKKKECIPEELLRGLVFVRHQCILVPPYVFFSMTAPKQINGQWDPDGMRTLATESTPARIRQAIYSPFSTVEKWRNVGEMARTSGGSGAGQNIQFFDPWQTNYFMIVLNPLAVRLTTGEKGFEVRPVNAMEIEQLESVLMRLTPGIIELRHRNMLPEMNNDPAYCMFLNQLAFEDMCIPGFFHGVSVMFGDAPDAAMTDSTENYNPANLPQVIFMKHKFVAKEEKQREKKPHGIPLVETLHEILSVTINPLIEPIPPPPQANSKKRRRKKEKEKEKEPIPEPIPEPESESELVEIVNDYDGMPPPAGPPLYHSPQIEARELPMRAPVIPLKEPECHFSNFNEGDDQYMNMNCGLEWEEWPEDDNGCNQFCQDNSLSTSVEWPEDDNGNQFCQDNPLTTPIDHADINPWMAAADDF